MGPTRRQFLKSAGAVLTMLALPPSVRAAQETSARQKNAHCRPPRQAAADAIRHALVGHRPAPVESNQPGLVEDAAKAFSLWNRPEPLKNLHTTEFPRFEQFPTNCAQDR